MMYIITKSQSKLETIYPWVIWILGASFFFYKYLVQVSPSVMTNDLMQTFQVHGAGLGNLSAFYFYAYLIMQIPVGILLDKYSPRLLTTLAILTCAISTYFFSQTHTFWLACVSRALIGAGAAFAAISCFKLATVWFPANRFALVSGLCMTAAMLGAVGGQMPLSILVQELGWRAALVIISLLGVLLGFIYFMVIRDKVEKNHTVQVQAKTKYRFISILTNKQAWLLSLYSGLAFAPVSVFGGLWGVPFLETAYQFSRTQAAFAVSWIFIGFALGSPLFGWLSNYIGRRKPILYLGTSLALSCLLMVLYSPYQNVVAACVFLFLFGFGTSGFFTSFAMISEIFPISLAATVLGFMNTFDSVCEALSEPLVGIFLDLTWRGNQVEGLHLFTIDGYHLALLLLPIYLVTSLIILFFIKETYCKPVS